MKHAAPCSPALRTWAARLIDDVERENGGVVLGGQTSEGVDPTQQAPYVELVQRTGLGVGVDIKDVLASCMHRSQCGVVVVIGGSSAGAKF